MALGLYLAALADRLIKGAGVYQTLLIWPYAIAPAIAGVLWLFMFNGNIGLASYYLKALGYEWNHTLKGDQAMFLVILASSWGRISYNFLFFLAGLQAIPKSIIEAAAIDAWSASPLFRCVNFTSTSMKSTHPGKYPYSCGLSGFHGSFSSFIASSTINLSKSGCGMVLEYGLVLLMC